MRIFTSFIALTIFITPLYAIGAPKKKPQESTAQEELRASGNQKSSTKKKRGGNKYPQPLPPEANEAGPSGHNAGRSGNKSSRNRILDRNPTQNEINNFFDLLRQLNALSQPVNEKSLQFFKILNLFFENAQNNQEINKALLSNLELLLKYPTTANEYCTSGCISSIPVFCIGELPDEIKLRILVSSDTISLGLNRDFIESTKEQKYYEEILKIFDTITTSINKDNLPLNVQCVFKAVTEHIIPIKFLILNHLKQDDEIVSYLENIIENSKDYTPDTLNLTRLYLAEKLLGFSLEIKKIENRIHNNPNIEKAIELLQPAKRELLFTQLPKRLRLIQIYMGCFGMEYSNNQKMFSLFDSGTLKKTLRNLNDASTSRSSERITIQKLKETDYNDDNRTLAEFSWNFFASKIKSLELSVYLGLYGDKEGTPLLKDDELPSMEYFNYHSVDLSLSFFSLLLDKKRQPPFYNKMSWNDRLKFIEKALREMGLFSSIPSYLYYSGILNSDVADPEKAEKVLIDHGHEYSYLQLELAKKLYNKGNIEEAILWLASSAKSGNPKASIILANYYIGNNKNFDVGFQLLQKLYHLGLIHFAKKALQGLIPMSEEVFEEKINTINESEVDFRAYLINYRTKALTEQTSAEAAIGGDDLERDQKEENLGQTSDHQLDKGKGPSGSGSDNPTGSDEGDIDPKTQQEIDEAFAEFEEYRLSKGAVATTPATPVSASNDDTYKPFLTNDIETSMTRLRASLITQKELLHLCNQLGGIVTKTKKGFKVVLSESNSFTMHITHYNDNRINLSYGYWADIRKIIESHYESLLERQTF